MARKSIEPNEMDRQGLISIDGFALSSVTFPLRIDHPMLKDLRKP
jgi:hypothetical protein